MKGISLNCQSLLLPQLKPELTNCLFCVQLYMVENVVWLVEFEDFALGHFLVTGKSVQHIVVFNLVSKVVRQIPEFLWLAMVLLQFMLG